LKEKELIHAQVLVGGDTFVGFRRCFKCGHVELMDPKLFPYDKPGPTHCGTTMIPLLDKEVSYYLEKEWKIKENLRNFSRLLESGGLTTE
jgi:hypothetical protein